MKPVQTEFAHIGGLQLEDCIDEGLATVHELLAACPDAAEARAFRRQAESYARTVASWRAFRPTDEQLHAMLECISEMLEVMRDCAQPPNESGMYPSVSLRVKGSLKNE